MLRPLAILALIVFECSAASCISETGEKVRFERMASAEVARHLHPADAPRARLLLLGTFHFMDAGLDGYKPQFNVDILSPERQAQVIEVVELIEAYQPTKIAIESRPSNQDRLDELYRQYRAGEFKLRSGEEYQLGFRLADRLDHERLYAIDAVGYRIQNVPAALEFAQAHGQESLLTSPYNNAYTAMYEADDQRKMQTSLREELLYMNAESRLLAGHGHYFIGGFAIGDGETFPGADGFITSWYNRNLRIFANLLRLADSPDERILVIFGAGHIPILRHIAQATPQVELVEVVDYLARD